MTKKLLFLISPDFPPNIIGGQGIYLNELFENIDREKYSVNVITSSLSGAEHNPDRGIYVVESRSLLVFPFHAMQLISRLNVKDYVVHGNELYIFPFAFKRKNNFKLAMTCHNSYLQRMRAAPLFKKCFYLPLIILEIVVCLLSNAVISVSENTSRNLQIQGIKSLVIHNGVNTASFSPSNKSDFRSIVNLNSNSKVVVFVGRLVNRKNPDALIRTMPLLDASVNYVVVGKGPLEDKLKSLSERLGVSNRVFLLGHLDHKVVASLLSSADTLILPSYGEGLPLTLLEAISCGLPILCTKDASGSSPVVQEGINGHVLASICPEEIYSKLSLCLANQKKYSKSSRLIAETEFSLKRFISLHEEVYDAL